MKSFKESLNKYMGEATTIVASVIFFAIPVSIMTYQAHKSGFIQAYNRAVTRNAVTSKEELKFKQTLISEIGGLQEQGHNLEQVVSWLKTK